MKLVESSPAILEYLNFIKCEISSRSAYFDLLYCHVGKNRMNGQNLKHFVNKQDGRRFGFLRNVLLENLFDHRQGTRFICPNVY